MKKLMIMAALVSMTAGTGFPVYADTAYISEQKEEITRIYDDHGEVVQIIVTLHENEQAELVQDLKKQVLNEDLSLLSPMDPETGLVMLSANGGDSGKYSFIDGLCQVIELLSGYSCIDIARYVGLTFINGLYMMNNRPYTGTWKVEYGYIPGCEPRHSQTCFRAVYTKIG